MIFHVLLQRADGSFYFAFHIKCDYFLVPKAACRSSVSSLIFYVGKTQQDLLSVGWHLNKRRRANILTSCSRGNFVPPDPHPCRPCPSPFSDFFLFFLAHNNNKHENNSTSSKMPDYHVWAGCQTMDPALFCSRTVPLTQGSDLSSCVMIISHNIFRSQM